MWSATTLAIAAVLAPGATGAERPAVPLARTADSQTFTDPAGDQQGTAPDITAIQVSNDDSENIEIRVTLANRADLNEDEAVRVLLDTDRNLSTGCFPGLIGADYWVAVNGHAAPEPDFFLPLRCEGPQPDPNTPDGGFTGTIDAATQTVVFRFTCADAGRPASFQFLALASSEKGNYGDFAGERFPWVYQLTPPCSKDVAPPSARALASRGVHGQKAPLRYRISDDSKETREQVRVFRGRRVLWQKATRLASTDAARLYAVEWQVPKKVVGKLKFCVQAWDRAGNRSGVSCAPLTIR